MAEELNDKLYKAVRRGKTALILKYLDQGANINHREKQKGATPLIEACVRRNYVVQKLLLSNGANPNLSNFAGLTPLHFASEVGDGESVKLLLAYQASIDKSDLSLCTPLHYAANRNRINTADLLVFCGANAAYKDDSGRSPMSGCTDPKMKELLKHSEIIQIGIKNNDIFIQHSELEQNNSVHLKKIGLTIHVPETFKTNSLSFLCRRVRPEYCQPSLKPVGRELLMSDTFEFRLSEVQIKGLVTLEIPLYDYLDPFEDVYLKTDTKPEICLDDARCRPLTDLRKYRDEDNPIQMRWICVVQMDITQIRAFNLVTLPKVEHFTIDKSGGGKFTSKVDKFVKVSAPPGTFDKEGDLSLEVIPCPPYREDVYKQISSVSHFYDINYNKLLGFQPNKDVQLTIPLPHYYDGDKDFYILSANGTSDYYAECDLEHHDDRDLSDIWEFVETSPQTHNGKVECTLSHFSICVLAEAKKETTRNEVIKHVDELCIKAAKREIFIIFFAVIKAVIDTDFYELVIECTTNKRINERKNDWFKKQYTDKNLECTGEFQTVPGKGYKIRFQGNIQPWADISNISLQYHPKRTNFQKIQVALDDKNGLKYGAINIYEDRENQDPVYLTTVALSLPGFTNDVKLDEETGFKGFTRDKFLKMLADKIGDEWIKMSILLGLTYKTVKAFKKNKTKALSTTKEKTLKVLQQWREISMHRLDNYGVPDLIASLHKVGREDLVSFPTKVYKIWWQKKLGQEWEEVLINLELEGKDIDKIKEDKQLNIITIITRCLIRWRNSHQNRNDCLEELYQALEEAERFDILKSLQEEAKTTDLLDDKNLQNMVAKKLGKEWREVMINLGLGSSEIEQIETENESHVVTLITKGLMIWRDRNSRNKSDRQHLMELYKALQDAGRSDIVGDLKQEFNTDGAFQDPEPMSDIHLLLLIENCTDEELFSVWTLLDISEGEIDTICKDPLSTNQQHQLLNNGKIIFFKIINDTTFT
ncbi:hypothetical protein KUTeg_016795 [Tegillarca granosa]|uniref:Death domain-containing protein n=1 Tax=Tegillarca granosa TaxID=220873 RepID=A0ABQ9ERT0_TEGGR|nr:hypothetical protein KUTeg_016795 [Tegillarca granosa]